MRKKLLRKEIYISDGDDLAFILKRDELKNVDLSKVTIDITTFEEGCCEQCRHTVTEVKLIWHEET